MPSMKSQTRYRHIALRLPPYYCVLNPIEFAWPQVKRKVQLKNLKASPIEELVKVLESPCESVTKEHWQNYIRHVEEIEETYRLLNPVFDSKVVIPLNDSLTDDSEEEN
ncbi:hypothetical protein ANN_00227 [Periplaneta americana]|uniref:Tc1-like transposase DDE domain-containing protein n=1 Tax=Periplaneta americana TaxID=6978 RepID=A0ABQ8TRU5_PERAM|nr:hypothetical protein ANN_00227 [Periplaneta americana]